VTVIVASSRGSSNDEGSERRWVLTRSQFREQTGNGRDRYLSKTPKDIAKGICVRANGILSVREHVVRSVSGSYVATGIWAGTE
jgi:hypothetical protein